jgi:hypothetical protein
MIGRVNPTLQSKCVMTELQTHRLRSLSRLAFVVGGAFAQAMQEPVSIRRVV